jgi:RND family efflux transporter MFP subunit
METIAMRQTGLFICALELVCSAGAALGQVDAVTKPKKDLRLAFSTSGLIAKIHVKAGDMVQKDQLLMSLDDTARKAVIELYQLRANSSLGKQAADAKLTLSKLERDRVTKTVREGAANQAELDRADAQVQVDALSVEQAVLTQLEAAQELAREQALHDQYFIKAPQDGVVQEIIVHEGEAAEALRPVIRLVVIDPIWIDAPVPDSQTQSLKMDDAAWVQFASADGDMVLEGKIIFIAPVAEAGSETRIVTVELANPEKNKNLAGRQVVVHFRRPPGVKAVSKAGQ